MIILRRYRVTVSPRGTKRLLHPKIVKKWPNEHDFGFDIFNKAKWLLFLQRYRNEKGKLLPQVTDEGEDVAYEVYVWGVPTWMKEKLNSLGLNDGYTCLFPGYDEDKKRNIEVAGVIRDLKVFKDIDGSLYIKRSVKKRSFR